MIGATIVPIVAIDQATAREIMSKTAKINVAGYLLILLVYMKPYLRKSNFKKMRKYTPITNNIAKALFRDFIVNVLYSGSSFGLSSSCIIVPKFLHLYL
jgi:hypothetical protein